MSEGADDQLPHHEKLSRFVLKKEWLRAPTESHPFVSIKQDAFVPPKDLQLSVSRHHGISVEQLNEIGKSVALETRKLFYGRADITALVASKNALKAVAAPLANNPNHAHIIGWPADKQSRMTIAQKIAAEASFVPITD